MTEAPHAPGTLPSLDWLPINALIVDQRYQRDAKRKVSLDHVIKIAEAFSWRYFQPPTVAPIGGGQYAILDGQHRFDACRLVDGIDKVPCYIVEAPEIRDQAKTFVAVNTTRMAVNSCQLFHAKVAAGDPDALHVKAVLDEAGLSVPRNSLNRGDIKPMQTLATGQILKLLHLYGDRPVKSALGVLVDAYRETPGHFRATLISGLVELFVVNEDREVDRARLARFFASSDAAEFEKAAQAYRAHFGGTTAAAIRAAITRFYNKGLPQERRLVDEEATS